MLCHVLNFVKNRKEKFLFLFKLFLFQNVHVHVHVHVSPAQSVVLTLTKVVTDFSVGTETKETILFRERPPCACLSLIEVRRQQNHEYSHHLTS